MKKTIFIFLIFSSCYSLDFDQDIQYRIDPRVKRYIDKFYHEAHKYGIDLKEGYNLIVSIEELPPGESAAAISYRIGQQNIIIVSPNAYEFFTSGTWIRNADSAYYGLENLIYHELGHTLLKRGHECSDCYSIMSPGLSFFAYTCSDCPERRALMEELFSKK